MTIVPASSAETAAQEDQSDPQAVFASSAEVSVPEATGALQQQSAQTTRTGNADNLPPSYSMLFKPTEHDGTINQSYEEELPPTFEEATQYVTVITINH